MTRTDDSGVLDEARQAGPRERDADQARRRERMAVLANCDWPALEARWREFGHDPECELIRGPETGLVALRGRIGGGGAPFNFGEATVTRATVRLRDGSIGHAVMLGRDTRKVKLAAVIDAMTQSGDMAQRIETSVIAPLRQARIERDSKRRAETAATKVDFFTMVRGED